MFGFVRVACITPKAFVCDTQKNCEEIIEKINEAEEKKTDVAVFPELCVTGASCGDMFFQDSLLKGANIAVGKITEATKGKNAVICVGTPVVIKEKIYNCGVVIHNGKILGISVKTFLKNKEERFFSSSKALKCDKISSRIFTENNIYDIPAGNNLIFDFNGCVSLGYEIGSDIYSPLSPSCYLTLAGADLIVNSGADTEIASEKEARKDFIKSISKKNMCAYAYSSAGAWESTSSCVYCGHKIISRNGKILKENTMIAEAEGMIIFDVDIQKARAKRKKSSVFKNTDFGFETKTVFVNSKNNFCGNGELAEISNAPFLPKTKKEISQYCENIFALQVAGLKKRLSVTNAKAVVGVSGGLDSTLALLVCTKTAEELNCPLTDVVGITMPGFGTTDRTKDNSHRLMENLGISHREISIKNACETHFKDIGHDIEVHNLTYENAQARERTQILMDYAGEIGGMVIGTGDLSELCLGWCTYNGDQMSMYGVNSGIPKTLIKEIVSCIAKNDIFKNCSDILSDIVNTPISPELLPPEKDGSIKQKTEDIVGPYELHDFFIYYALKYGFSPSKIYHLATIAFKGVYDNETLLKWLKNFYGRFFTQQFKRSCSPDGIQVLDISISPFGGLVMPSDACVNIWKKEIESLK